MHGVLELYAKNQIVIYYQILFLIVYRDNSIRFPFNIIGSKEIESMWFAMSFVISYWRYFLNNERIISTVTFDSEKVLLLGAMHCY